MCFTVVGHVRLVSESSPQVPGEPAFGNPNTHISPRGRSGGFGDGSNGCNGQVTAVNRPRANGSLLLFMDPTVSVVLLFAC